MSAIAGLVIALGIFFIVFSLSYSSSPLGKRLEVITGTAQEEEAEFGSLRHKLELAGIKVPEDQVKNAYWGILGGAALLGFILALLVHLPPLAAVVMGLIAAFLVRSYIEGRVTNYCKKVEKEVPQTLTEFATLVQLQASSSEILSRAAKNLGPRSLLSKHLQYYADLLAQKGPDAWKEIIENARILSPTLAVVMYSLSRLAQRGGAGFAEAFAKMAEGISSSLAAREEAFAKGQSALTAVKIIAGIMLVLITFLAVDPVYRPAVLSLPGQMAIALAIVMMVIGYWYCTDKINSIF